MSSGLAESAVQTARMINGAEAMALAFDLAGVRIAYTYPITPQIEVIEELSHQSGITYIQADSEYNVLAGAQGVLWTGERCAVATSSQGLVLMSEVMWEVSGNRLPLVMGIFNRGLKGPGWSLGTQQNDTLFMRDTGWLQFYCESAQEMLDFMLIVYRVAEELCLPAMVCGDGFYLSHETEEVMIPSRESATAFVGERMQCRAPMLDGRASYGGLVPAPKYFRACHRLHEDVCRSAEVFDRVAAEFAGRFGRRHGTLAPVYTDDAETVVVAAGTMCGTIREVVERRRARGEKIGMVKMNAFRPFPYEALADAVGGARKVVVMDRNVAPGLGGIFAGEVRLSLYRRRSEATVFSFVTGLGGMDVPPETVERCLEYVAAGDDRPPETLFLYDTGIEE